MIATPLIQQEQTIPVNLPTVAKAPQAKVDREDRFVAVAVDAKGFYVDNRTKPVSLTELRTRLRALAGEAKPPVIRIRGDASVPYQRVADLINEVQRAGLTRVKFDFKTD